MENLARVYKEEFEPDIEDSAPEPIRRMEAANDRDPVPNDNEPVITAEDKAQIETLKEQLNARALQNSERSLPEQIVEVPPTLHPEHVPVAAEVQTGTVETAAAESAPEAAGASGGSERKDGDSTSGGSRRRTPERTVVEKSAGGKENSKKGKFGWMFKTLKGVWTLAKWVVLIPTLIAAIAIRKGANFGLGKAGYPEGGKGGGSKPAASKPASGGGGGHH